jgi:hypothetical protein
VPIDVLAERLNTTRGALYEALHDARQQLRRRLAAREFTIEGEQLCAMRSNGNSARCSGRQAQS